jgi:thiol-disulfide isomerase/thioredoxin
MRKLLVALALTALTALAGTADEAKPAKGEKKSPGSLKVGDPAPALKASKWLQGEEVKEFKTGKIYVVEFWATWCGPCIVMMPHLGAMQAAYRDKGVTFIGFSAKDPSNTEEKVAAFVKKRGPKLKYTFAYGDDRDTYDAWMRAAGRSGIPCSFVVDRAGKIAYIGHPMYLDLVLPKVIAGTWKGAESKEELDRIDKEVNGVFRALSGRDARASLKALTDFETRHPALAHIPYFLGPKMSLLLQAGKEGEARKMAEEVLERAVKQDDPTALRAVSAVMRSGKAKENKEMLGLSLKAAQAMLKVAGDKDAGALFNLAEVYFATGDRARAREYGRKAIAAADSPAVKGFYERQVKAFEEKKEEK